MKKLIVGLLVFGVAFGATAALASTQLAGDWGWDRDNQAWRDGVISNNPVAAKVVDWIHANILWVKSLVILILLWSLAWKGYSLWLSARAGSKVWFIVLLLVNTVGILDILYIYSFRKSRKAQKINN